MQAKTFEVMSAHTPALCDTINDGLVCETGITVTLQSWLLSMLTYFLDRHKLQKRTAQSSLGYLLATSERHHVISPTSDKAFCSVSVSTWSSCLESKLGFGVKIGNSTKVLTSLTVRLTPPCQCIVKLRVDAWGWVLYKNNYQQPEL